MHPDRTIPIIGQPVQNPIWNLIVWDSIILVVLQNLVVDSESLEHHDEWSFEVGRTGMIKCSSDLDL